MSFPEDQIEELKSYCSKLKRCEEGGCTYFLLEGLQLPEGCSPPVCDALLCPTARDGYPSRLFLAEQVQSPMGRNWNATAVRICERNWYAYSWNVSRSELRLAQLLVGHLKALT